MCGSCWFELRRPKHDAYAGVAFDVDGTVAAWTGEPYCVECGTQAPELPVRFATKMVLLPPLPD